MVKEEGNLDDEIGELGELGELRELGELGENNIYNSVLLSLFFYTFKGEIKIEINY